MPLSSKTRRRLTKYANCIKTKCKKHMQSIEKIENIAINKAKANPKNIHQMSAILSKLEKQAKYMNAKKKKGTCILKHCKKFSQR